MPFCSGSRPPKKRKRVPGGFSNLWICWNGARGYIHKNCDLPTMSQPIQITVLGRDHEEPGRVFAQNVDSSNMAFGTSPGVTSKPNEDGIGVSVLNSEFVLAIADGHW